MTKSLNFKTMMKYVALFFLVVITFLNGCHHAESPAPIDKSLVLYLPQNGKTLDASSYSEDTVVDISSFTADRKGVANQASLFDSVRTYIQIKNSLELDTLTNITLSAWIKPIDWRGTGSNPIISKAYLSSLFTLPYYQYHLGITGTKDNHFQGSVIFSLSINGQYVYAATPNYTFTPGVWIHIAGTYDGTNMKVYINGALNTTFTSPGKMGHYGNDVFIGKLGSPTTLPSNTPGTFDELRIYNRALSAAEISTLYSE
jgi:hypothetical protein